MQCSSEDIRSLSQGSFKHTLKKEGVRERGEDIQDSDSGGAEPYPHVYSFMAWLKLSQERKNKSCAERLQVIQVSESPGVQVCAPQ